MDFTLLVFSLLPVVAASHKVDLPREVVFKMGDRRELTCSMRSCPGELTFVWSSLEDKPLFVDVENKPTESVLIFENVTRNHENTVVCTATCGMETKQAKTAIKVYSFPRNPVISGNDALILGEENILTCEVSHVYPSEYLEVELLQGDTVLQTKEGELGGDGLLITHKFRPSSEDDGNGVTCRASLNMNHIESDGMTRETTGLLSVLSAPHNVRVSGFAAVSLGSGFTLTCEAAGSPELAFTWTALKPDGQRVEMGKHRELFVQNVSLTDAGVYRCEVSNRLGSQTADVSVVVKAPPMDTIIEARPQTVLNEGESISIYCKSNGVPVELKVLRLTVDGRETELKTSVGAETTFTLDSVKLSDSGLYVCEAFNEYGRQRATLKLTVENHLLEVALQPYGVTVAERGSSHALSCQASGCPQPTFSWRRFENLPTRGLTKTSGFLSQLFFDPVELEDEGTYICEVTCGSVAVSKHTKMKLFSFPSSPVLESSGPSLEGEKVRLICSVRDVFPADLFNIIWMDGEEELFSPERADFSSRLQNLTSGLSFALKAKHNDRLFSCKVLLEMDGVPAAHAIKTSSTALSLHYPPRGTRITVSPQVDLKEGESVSISCLSDSVPVGRVVLRRVVDAIETELKANEGAETSVILPSVELGDSGLYVCEAFNQYGSHQESVQVIVKAPPRNTTVEVLPSSEVQEGQNVTICCNSVSFPPPAVVLRKLDSGPVIHSPDGVFQLINLTPNDTGLYQVNVTNDLGYETEIFLINVKEKRFESTPSWNHFVTPAVCLGSALALLCIIVYLWRESKKGSYDITKCNPDTV
ncbi:Vascular cell adhesion protein 1 [Triplophysa tibetana]|uniref:Vascular cell adhesion protein 1 n=1 Tax=Triplophysa tibetana TaxID=1572043 RepID=A0A5A9NTB7_9TELE|nr:Vascular cell adhesion protein 1 [Triplophysa tibetana]